MVKEVLFRAIREDNGLWHIGSLIVGGQYECAIYNRHTDMYSGIRVIPESVGQYVMKDIQGRRIFVHDVVEGYRGHLRGDGYLRKGHPDKIRVWLRVSYSYGGAHPVGFYLDEIAVHPEERQFVRHNPYRSILYSLRESRADELKDRQIEWLGQNNTISLIGNVFDNPNFLKL